MKTLLISLALLICAGCTHHFKAAPRVCPIGTHKFDFKCVDDKFEDEQNDLCFVGTADSQKGCLRNNLHGL